MGQSLLELLQVDVSKKEEITTIGTAVLELLRGNVGKEIDPDISLVILATVGATLASATNKPMLYLLRLSVVGKLVLDNVAEDEEDEDE